jgi:hypothetical protein
MFVKIQDFPSYEINEEGIVRRVSDKYELVCDMSKGYKSVHLYKDGKGKHKLLHRLLAQAFLPNPENLPTIDHVNRNKLDNRLENLKWETRTGQNLNRGRYTKQTNTGQPNISYNKRDDAYVVQLQKNFTRYKRNFKTLEQAIHYRDETLHQLY